MNVDSSDVEPLLRMNDAERRLRVHRRRGGILDRSTPATGHEI